MTWRAISARPYDVDPKFTTAQFQQRSDPHKCITRIRGQDNVTHFVPSLYGAEARPGTSFAALFGNLTEPSEVHEVERPY